MLIPEEKKMRFSFFRARARTRPISSGSKSSAEKTDPHTKIVNQCLLPHPRRAHYPGAPATPIFLPLPLPPSFTAVPPSIARRHAGTHSQRVANYYSRYTSHRFVVHRQRRLLFIVHHIAVPVTTRSYNTTTGRIRRGALFRIALQRYADVTNGTEGESARTRLYSHALVLSCSLARPFVDALAYTRACARVGTPRVRSSKYKVNTSPRHGDVYCALVRCFIGVTLRDSFQYTLFPLLRFF